jgi:hypothetical protein
MLAVEWALVDLPLVAVLVRHPAAVAHLVIVEELFHLLLRDLGLPFHILFLLLPDLLIRRLAGKPLK